MADNPPDISRIRHLHAGTLRLISVANELEDDFLKYIYNIALRDLEEKAEAVNKHHKHKRKPSHDPAIVELAAQLRALAPRKK